MKSIGTDAEPIEILLVEDTPGDVRLTREAFKDAKVHISLPVASDGAEAMDFLNPEGEHVKAARPDQILFDLDLPKRDGREVLEEIKESPTLKSGECEHPFSRALERAVLSQHRNSSIHLCSPEECCMTGTIRVLTDELLG